MELYNSIESRRSFRSFIPKAVDKPTLTKILAAANRSPSDMNTQPWEVFVVAGEKKTPWPRNFLKRLCQGQLLSLIWLFPKNGLIISTGDHRNIGSGVSRLWESIPKTEKLCGKIF